MRSIEESMERWKITVDHSPSLKDLKKSVRLDGNESPCNTGLRSVCWKTFLLFQRTDVSGWSRMLTESRNAYTSLREHLLRYIENPDELGTALDPLDDDLNSPWNTLRQDEETRAEIFQDIERCMPEEPFFRQHDTQRIMLDILFIFCKINQDVGYRQGMHEILAPILWVVEKDAIDHGSTPRQLTESDDILKQTLDPSYIEHDAFTLLSLVMRTAKSFYELGEPEVPPNTHSLTPGAPQGLSPIVERSKRIHEVYLACLDPALAKHLTDIEVLPQIFLIRWIRLLFGREFPFDQLLEMWDVMFGEDPGLELVDMVCVSMLLRIRWQLIEANYSVALMLLLKYPAPIPPHGPQTFVDDAIYLRDNYSAVGGANIISKYSGKPPAITSESQSSTPFSQTLSPRLKLSKTMSPIPSPASFLQQQGGVEALLRGAAKGVFDRGERLGINQAVRDAAGEVKKNMQGLQTPRPNSTPRRASDNFRWSLDEGRSVQSPTASYLAMSNRNLQLARMLDQAVSGLRSSSVSREAMDIACAKVDFVKVYLEDASMPLPADQDGDFPDDGPQSVVNETPSFPAQEPVLKETKAAPKALDITTPPEFADADLTTSSVPMSVDTTTLDSPQTMAGLSKAPEVQSTNSITHEFEQVRPKAPVPTRSTIANSSFSWMLEPEPSANSSLKPSSPKSSSPFLKSGRKSTSGPSREKAAFLFGDDGGESKITTSNRSPLLADIDEGFNLTTMKHLEEN